MLKSRHTPTKQEQETGKTIEVVHTESWRTQFYNTLIAASFYWEIAQITFQEANYVLASTADFTYTLGNFIYDRKSKLYPFIIIWEAI